jgi:DNA topoisomerase-2
MKKVLNLSTYIEEIYKEYALYVLESRAIPDWTGLKRSQIKILWVAEKQGRKNMKTLSMTGKIICDAMYHHSPDSLTETLCKMAQDFCGANNFPLIDGTGSFGSQLDSSFSAPRYTEVKLSNNFDYLFPKEDFPIAPTSPDPENPEPLFMLPILPISLINGINGIAVGFSSKIFSRNILSLIEFVRTLLKNKTPDDSLLQPYFKSYRGEIIKENDNYIMKGRLTKQPKNIVLIDEVPLKYEIIPYKEFLFKLKDDDKIKSFTDESDGKWKLYVKLDDSTYSLSEETLMEMFDLKFKLNENITIIGIDGNVKVFETASDYLNYFVDCRKGFYDLRKNNMLKENGQSILKLKIKKDIMESLRNGMSRSELSETVEKKLPNYKKYFNNISFKLDDEKFSETVSDVINSIKLTESLSDKRSEYESEILKLETERKRLSEYTVVEMYLEDLKNLERYIKKNDLA